MQNLLTSSQMRETDLYTIKNQPISSVDLMENAAQAFVKAFKKRVNDPSTKIAVLCGPGNNGGDGLAIARLLIKAKYKQVQVNVILFAAKQSDDFVHNLNRLEKLKVPVTVISSPDEFKFKGTVIIDAILGSGLNKPLTGKYAALAKLINQHQAQVIAVDIPTGLNSEGPIPANYNGIKADLVISFQRPKINFFFPESAKALNQYKVVDIGLTETFIQEQTSVWKLTEKKDIEQLLRARTNFSHKGTYGHALVVAGTSTTMGAALLTAKACVYAGAGLTTVCLPQSGLTALNTALPEAMAMPTSQFLAIEAFEKFAAMGIGPGLGTSEENEELFEQLLALKKPMALDADALTMLSARKDLMDQLPPATILTPHVKEFDRLFGVHANWWERLQTAIKEAVERKLIIVLKNQYTFICLPNGEVRINPTGNPGMASGGMGDVLTGIITAFVAQGYATADAAILACYVHGKTGDRLAKKNFTISASQIALGLPKTIKRLADDYTYSSLQ